jgi:hypothetical protein
VKSDQDGRSGATIHHSVMHRRTGEITVLTTEEAKDAAATVQTLRGFVGLWGWRAQRLARGLTQSGFARNGKPAPRNYSPAIAGLVVQPGDIADTCSDTSLTLFGLVKSISAIWWAAK